jgi:MFS family permease
VRVVVALFLLGIDAVGESRVESRRDAVGLTHEASAAHEDQCVSAGVLATVPASAGPAAGDIRDAYSVVVEERSPGQHAPILAVERECPRAHGRSTGTVAGVAALAVLLTGQALASMDASILIVAAPSIRSSLHASGAELQLIVGTYTLTFGALVVTGARLGDILGRPRAFVLGLGAFTGCSLVGGLAPDPVFLIVARGFQGAAAALMTPQVLSIIQVQFEGERRARAIGAYSMILSVGVAAGQILGGLLVTAHLLAAAWRPALLLNAPIGAALLIASRLRLAPISAVGGQRLDLTGAGLLAATMLALLVPLSFGRDYGWPPWIWLCFAACALGASLFVVHERRFRRRGGDPLFDIGLLRAPRVAAGVIAVLLVMSCYTGFLVSLTLHLQGGLGFTALHAGLTFAIYAGGFATASLTWTRAGAAARARLPIIGPLVMSIALLGIGLSIDGHRWSPALTTPLLFVAGLGHACGFSPLAHGLAGAVRQAQAAHLSGLILTASLVGQVVGIAAFVAVYLSAAARSSAHGLFVTTWALSCVLAVTAACAFRARVAR